MRSTSSAVSRAAAGLYAALAAQVVSVTALAVFDEARGRRLASQIAAFGGDPASPAARSVSGAATVFAVLVLVLLATTVTTAIAYLSWLRQVRPATPPAALAAACLLPGVNLVAPPFLADLAWREAPARRHGRPADRTRRENHPDHGEPGNRPTERTRWLVILACWWLSWLAALGLVFAGPARDGLTGLGTQQAAALAVAALLCASAVREVTARHAGGGHGHGTRPSIRPAVRLNHAERPSGMPTAEEGGMAGTFDDAGSGTPDDGPGHVPGTAHITRTAPGNGDGKDHLPGDGPELPELACQSRRWGSAGRPERNRPSRAAGGAPLSE